MKLLEKVRQKWNNEKEYSKIWISTWQSFVMFWCSVYFVVDIIFNQAEHSVELCTTLVISIAAIFIPYLAKSYFGKRNEEWIKNKEVLNEEVDDVIEEENTA